MYGTHANATAYDGGFEKMPCILVITDYSSSLQGMTPTFVLSVGSFLHNQNNLSKVFGKEKDPHGTIGVTG